MTARTARVLRYAPWLPPAAALVLPLVQDNAFRLRVLTLAFLYAGLAMALTLSLGFAGLFNMSQGTFFGLGAYTTAIATTEWHHPLLVAAIEAVALTAAVGVLLGLTSIRVRGDYWALVSMAFTVGTYEAIQNTKDLTGGLDGYIGASKLSIGGLHLDTPTRYYYVALVVALVCYFGARSVARTFAGRAMLAVKGDPAAASMMAINPTYYKLLAMGVGSGLAGLAGAGLVVVSPLIHPSSFDLLHSFNITIFTVVGGGTHLLGSAFAATGLTYIVEQYRTFSDYQLMIYGFALLGAIALRSGVLADRVRAVRLRVKARRARLS